MSRSKSLAYSSTRRERLRRRNSRKIVIGVAASIALFLVFVVAWVGIRAFLAKGELEAVIPIATQLKSTALENDVAGVSRASSDLRQHADAAHALTSDPIWRAAELIPFAGPNLTAARELASSVRDLSNRAVGPLTKAASSISLADFKPVGGAIDLEPLLEARPVVEEAHAALLLTDAKLKSINTDGTVAPVREAVARLRTQVEELVPTVNVLKNAFALSPGMLGSDGPRDYLMVFQNPAELRSSGGIAGAMALVHTDKGKIELQQQASSADFPHYASPVLNLPEDTRGLYGSIVGEYIQDVNLTPNFELSGQLIGRMWEERYGTKVDGVISIDPVALSYILDATGPITTLTGDVLSRDNAVPLLLNEAYLRYSDSSQQDAFFASAAKSVFDKVASGSVDPVKLVQALSGAASERRVLIWSAIGGEQEILRKTSLSGRPVGELDGSERLGLFLNDATGAKMDYYLDVKAAVGEVNCRADGRPYVGVQVTLSNNAPANAGTALPRYLTGGGIFGVPPGNIRTLVSGYGGPEMVNLGVADGDAALDAHSATENGRPVSQVAVELAPGESATFLFGFLAESGTIGSTSLQMTPIINMNETSELALTCESALW